MYKMGRITCILSLCGEANNNAWCIIDACMRIPQRSRNNRLYSYSIYMIMETDKSQDLSSASWRLRRTSGIIPIWRSAGLRLSWSLKAGKKTDVPDQVHQAGGTPLYLGKNQPFNSLQAFHWLGRASCFTQSTNSSVKFIPKHPQKNTHSNVWPNTWAPHGPVMLTPKNNHHNAL